MFNTQVKNNLTAYDDSISMRVQSINTDTILYLVQGGKNFFLKGLQRSNFARLDSDPESRETTYWLIEQSDLPSDLQEEAFYQVFKRCGSTRFPFQLRKKFSAEELRRLLKVEPLVLMHDRALEDIIEHDNMEIRQIKPTDFSENMRRYVEECKKEIEITWSVRVENLSRELDEINSMHSKRKKTDSLFEIAPKLKTALCKIESIKNDIAAIKQKQSVNVSSKQKELSALDSEYKALETRSVQSELALEQIELVQKQFDELSVESDKKRIVNSDEERQQVSASKEEVLVQTQRIVNSMRSCVDLCQNIYREQAENLKQQKIIMARLKQAQALVVQAENVLSKVGSLLETVNAISQEVLTLGEGYEIDEERLLIERQELDLERQELDRKAEAIKLLESQTKYRFFTREVVALLCSFAKKQGASEGQLSDLQNLNHSVDGRKKAWLASGHTDKLIHLIRDQQVPMERILDLPLTDFKILLSAQQMEKSQILLAALTQNKNSSCRP